jgi:hypothetical protein
MCLREQRVVRVVLTCARDQVMFVEQSNGYFAKLDSDGFL